VNDKELLEKLSKARSAGGSQLKNAALGIVVLGDSSVIDVWTEDTAIAGIILQLEAEALGLGACWIQIRDRMHNQETTSEQVIRELFAIPEHLKVECMIAIGYPDEEKPAKKDEELAPERISFNTYRK
jgi:nitroreductase